MDPPLPSSLQKAGLSRSLLLTTFRKESFLVINPNVFNDAESFRDMLRSRVLPTEEEVRNIRYLVSLSRYAAERLQEQYKLYERFIEEQSYLTAPVRRLPPELLSDIFLQCQPINDVAMSGGSVAGQLGMVCKLWREITLSIPALWSSIRISLERTRPGAIPTIIRESARSLQLHLSRSRQAPLTVAISIASYHLPKKDVNVLLRPLIGQVHRWRVLDLEASSHLEELPSRIPLIESLTLRSHHDREAFNEAPLLRCLSIHYDTVESWPYITWSHITSLSLLGYQSNLHELLRSFPQLEQLHLTRCANGNDRPSGWNDEVLLPRVHTFQLSISKFLDREWAVLQRVGTQMAPELKPITYHATAFFDYLVLPAALRISISDTSAQDLRELPRFLERSPALEELTLKGTAFAGGELILCLKSAPNLTALNICNSSVAQYPSSFNDMAIRALRADPARSWNLLPKMLTLMISNIPQWLDVQKLTNTIASRVNVDHDFAPGEMKPLVRVYLSTPSAAEARRLRVSLQRLSDLKKAVIAVVHVDPV